MADFWIILTASLVAASCALLGCFLVLRKMAMIGDAISHAVLPGIVLAFLISGTRDSLPMLIGAASLGVFTTFLIEWISKKAKMQNDAAIGMVFTFLFALGIILLTLFADKVDLDADCVLHGEIVFVPLQLSDFSLGGIQIPSKILILAVVFILCLLVVLLGFKGFMLTSFDPFYASAIGISIALWHYLLMAMVSLVTVVSFESIGAILVVAFLVVPPAAAYLLTDNLKHMILYAVGIGVLASVLGYYFAREINGSIPGAMTTVLGVLFIITFLFAPQHGILRKFLKGRVKA